MLPLGQFAWEAPDRLAEVVALARVPGARLLSGGTDLIPSMKHRIFAPSVLVSTRRLPELRRIERRPDRSLHLGAGITLREIARHPDVLREFPALAAAARTVATPTIQAMATLGGNLMLDTRCMYYNQPAGWRAAIHGCLKCEGSVCHVAPKGSGCYAAHSADTVPVLTLAGAVARFQSGNGELAIPVADLYGGDGRDWIRVPPGAVLVGVELPPPTAPIAYRKLRQRGAIDYALLLTAVTRREEGLWEAVISAIGPAPIRVTADSPEALVEAAFSAVQPLSTHLQSVPWRKRMVRVELSRAIAAFGS